jgi:protein-tyrosine phosphatase
VIDLHAHLLPAIDDGAESLEQALAMARRALDDGVEQVVCTPHWIPGLYPNETAGITAALGTLRDALQREAIPLQLHLGAEIRLAPEILDAITQGLLPTLAGSRYFLLEAPHGSVPRGLHSLVFSALAQGRVPILAHPERFVWLNEERYGWFADLALEGAWLQLTAGAVTGAFGKQPRYWAERFLDDGLVHLIASDMHDPERRSPILSAARAAAAQRLGHDEAERLVQARPLAVIEDRAPNALLAPPGLQEEAPSAPAWGERLRRAFRRLAAGSGRSPF